MLPSTGTGHDLLDDDDREALGGEDDEGHEDGTDAGEERRARRGRRRDQQEGAAEQGGQGDEPRADAAELDPQLERAEGEGMVTEHAKISATDPGPEPPPEPEPSEPEPDHGPEDPAWEQKETRRSGA